MAAARPRHKPNIWEPFVSATKGAVVVPEPERHAWPVRSVDREMIVQHLQTLGQERAPAPLGGAGFTEVEGLGVVPLFEGAIVVSAEGTAPDLVVLPSEEDSILIAVRDGRMVGCAIPPQNLARLGSIQRIVDFEAVYIVHEMLKERSAAIRPPRVLLLNSLLSKEMRTFNVSELLPRTCHNARHLGFSWCTNCFDPIERRPFGTVSSSGGIAGDSQCVAQQLADDPKAAPATGKTLPGVEPEKSEPSI